MGFWAWAPEGGGSKLGGAGVLTFAGSSGVLTLAGMGGGAGRAAKRLKSYSRADGGRHADPTVTKQLSTLGQSCQLVDNCCPFWGRKLFPGGRWETRRRHTARRVANLPPGAWQEARR